MNIIETSGLTKKFGTFKAVDGISLSVRKAEIYGFLGLNGAGKTTTIRMLLGMVHSTAGSIRIAGRDIRAGRRGPWERIGYLVEMPYAYPELTVRENLQAVCKLRGIKDPGRADRIMEELHLTEYAGRKSGKLSLGNAQRLGLAKALVHEPEILILDEPSNGLDPAGIVEIRELIQDLSKRLGVTVFVSSHNLGEISRLATRIGIIHRGKLAQEIDSGRLNEMLRMKLTVDAREREKAAAFLVKKGYSVSVEENWIRLSDENAVRNPDRVSEEMVKAGLPPTLIKAEQEDLESYFLRLIGETI
jgi:ABC-2 type transport system ATP-binding protein